MELVESVWDDVEVGGGGDRQGFEEHRPVEQRDMAARETGYEGREGARKRVVRETG